MREIPMIKFQIMVKGFTTDYSLLPIDYRPLPIAYCLLTIAY